MKTSLAYEVFCSLKVYTFEEPLKGELHFDYIFLHFTLIGLEWDSITLFTKINFFVLPKLTFQRHLNKIYMAFY